MLRAPWILLYIFTNVFAALYMWSTGFLIGDVEGVRLFSESALFWAALLVVLSYIIIMSPLFSFLSKIRVAPVAFTSNKNDVDTRFGVFLILLQISYMFFNISTGLNIAGNNNERGGGALSLLWIAFPADLLFVVYYGVCRESRLFYPNSAIWLVSNLSRGWTGMLFIVMMLEWFRLVRSGRLTLLKVTIIALAAIVSYPVLSNLKWIFRASASSSFSFDGLVEALVSGLTLDDYLVLIEDGVMRIIGRLQVTSIVVEVMRFRAELEQAFYDGLFAPFWLDGIHGIAYERLFTGSRTMPIGVVFTGIGEFNWEFDVGDWNTNIGYVGWFFIAPYLAPVYVLYTLFLCFLSIFFAKKIGYSRSVSDVVWVSWILYLMPPWIGTFVNFIYAQIIFLSVYFILSRLPSVSLGWLVRR